MARAARLAGRPFWVHPRGDYVSDRVVQTGTWEPDIVAAAIGLLAGVESGVIVDAGAMLGTHTLPWALAKPGMVVHAFEPQPENRRLLTRNAGGLVNVVIHDEALSDVATYVAMAVSPDNMGHGVVRATDPWPESGMVPWTVRAVPLDSLGLADVRLMKVDVEWHEPQVLAGARATIERDRPHIIVEDWKHEYGSLLPGYHLAAEWEVAHQTFLYSPD